MTVSADGSDDALDLRAATAFDRTRPDIDSDRSGNLRDLSATARDRAPFSLAYIASTA